MLITEKVDSIKIKTNNFRIQNETSLVFPCLNYNIWELRASLEQIKLTKIFYPKAQSLQLIKCSSESKISQSINSQTTTKYNPKIDTHPESMIKTLHVVKSCVISDGPLKLWSMRNRSKFAHLICRVPMRNSISFTRNSSLITKLFANNLKLFNFFSMQRWYLIYSPNWNRYNSFGS